MISTKEYNRKYYLEHKEERNRQSREWNKSHPEKVRESIKKYQQTEKYKEYKRRYYERIKQRNKN